MLNPLVFPAENIKTTDYELLLTSIDDALCSSSVSGNRISLLLNLLHSHSSVEQHHTLWVLVLGELLNDITPTGIDALKGSFQTEERATVARVFELATHFLAHAKPLLLYPTAPHRLQPGPHRVTPFFNRLIGLFCEASRAHLVELAAVRLQELTTRFYEDATVISNRVAFTPLLTYLACLADHFGVLETLSPLEAIDALLVGTMTQQQSTRPTAPPAGLTPTHIFDYYLLLGRLQLQLYAINHAPHSLHAAGECFQVATALPALREGDGMKKNREVEARLYYLFTKLLTVSSLHDLEALADRDPMFWGQLQRLGAGHSGDVMQALDTEDQPGMPRSLEGLLRSAPGATGGRSERNGDNRDGDDNDPPVSEERTRTTLVGFYRHLFASFLRMDLGRLATRCKEYEETITLFHQILPATMVLPLTLVKELLFRLRLALLKRRLADLVTPVVQLEAINDRLGDLWLFTEFLALIPKPSTLPGTYVQVEEGPLGGILVDLVVQQSQDGLVDRVKAQQIAVLERQQTVESVLLALK